MGKSNLLLNTTSLFETDLVTILITENFFTNLAGGTHAKTLPTETPILHGDSAKNSIPIYYDCRMTDCSLIDVAETKISNTDLEQD